jgi:hypothetical protein
MNNEIDLSKIPNPKRNNDFKPIIPLGPNVFKITDVIAGKSKVKKTDYFEVHFVSRDDIPFSDTFYITGKTLTRIKEFLLNCGMTQDEVNRTDIKVEDIKNSIVGKEVRLLIAGEEFLIEDKIRIRRKLPYLYFSEAITIPEAESRLKYDEKWHMTKLKETNQAEAPSKEEDDLPF